ncbi:D-sedoheptulose-7-phosphate isomerase [Paenibacillus sacheonensis]|uniref:SIS domain-containing protein n=1 Tax=Paenibacillus sacheonensis TaxID=742054 RepID=A0A7X4YJN8_9BACL|nr:SIS domain-containing protein [Paenibacillus sacheonensis]MBM7564036.1 D-sedoheptulose 7-phosphate isomerase [Paenibacillus sacheonensis]NBC67631.1 SIS domain-containing protein [Paenibacillus sacheonensis]
MSATFNGLFVKYPDLEPCREQIRQAFEAMEASFRKGGKMLLAGNGGSAADCEHVVGELMKGFMSQRPLPAAEREKMLVHGEEGAYIADRLQGALPAISLVSQSALATAYINDVAADMVFAQQVYGYGRPEDTLVVFSTSGNSANVVRAVQVAKSLGMATIGLTGQGGGRLKELCDVTVCVPYDGTPDIQERHLPIYHVLCMLLEEAFFA